MIDCVFCGDKSVPRCKEDVFPLWIGRKLGYVARQRHPDTEPEYFNDHFIHREDLDTDEIVSQSKSGAIPVPYKVPEVCGECNGGWMSRLEQAAQHVLVGFIEGKQKLLSPYDQLVVATWMVKTCLTFDAALQPQLIPQQVGSRRFFALGYPLPGTIVTIGHDADLVPTGTLTHARGSGTIDDPSSGLAVPAMAVSMLFQFDHLILAALIDWTEDLSTFSADVIDDQRGVPKFHRLWPNQGQRFLWPSDAAIAANGSSDTTSGLSEEPMPETPT